MKCNNVIYFERKTYVNVIQYIGMQNRTGRPNLQYSGGLDPIWFLHFI